MGVKGAALVRAVIEDRVPVRGAQVAEGDFLEVVTTTPRVVCHFFHRDFERCKLLDQHLAALARRYIDTRFIRLSAPVRARPAVETGFRNVGEAAGPTPGCRNVHVLRSCVSRLSTLARIFNSSPSRNVLCNDCAASCWAASNTGMP